MKTHWWLSNQPCGRIRVPTITGSGPLYPAGGAVGQDGDAVGPADALTQVVPYIKTPESPVSHMVDQ